MKGKYVSGAIAFVLCFSGCSSKQESSTTIAYGTEVKLEDYFDLKKGEKISSDLTIDSKIIGNYEVKATIVGSDGKERKESKKLMVKDNDKPEINFLQPKENVQEIPFKADFNLVGNINKTADKVDGEYKEIDIVDKEKYEKALATIKEEKSKAEKQMFTSNDQIQEYKKKQLRSGYSMVSSDLNVEKEGSYTIRVSTIDKSYNITEESYKVKVAKEGEKVKDEKLAAGVKGTKMGNATSYKVNKDTPESKVASKEPSKEPSKQEKSLPKDNTQSQKKFESNVVSSGAISSQGSPVLQAALNYVGSHMMCDELVTMALVNGGYLTGTPEPIFSRGGYYNIGVYQMPPLGSYISEGQAVPGDLILYDNGGYGSMHVAVYAGNGKAVHGGYNGSDVVVSTVYLGSGPRYFRVSPMTWSDVSMKLFGHKSDGGGNIVWEDKPPKEPIVKPGNPDDTSGTEDPWGDIDWGEGSTLYTSTITYNSTTISLSSPTEIDGDYVFAQLRQMEAKEITMEQLRANLQGKGYTIVE